MDAPPELTAWTYATVENIVHQHEYERGRYEYKEVLNSTGAGKDEHLASIRRTVVSMANGSAGYILFGVRDRSMQVAAAQDRIVGIPSAGDLRKEFGDKLHTIERGISFDAHPIPLPGDGTKCIFVVQIPTSPRRPHAFAGTFYIRGEGGSAAPMSFLEVRDQMLYTEGRLQKVTLLRLELTSFIRVLNLLNEPSRGNVRLDSGAFKVLLADVSDLLPPASDLLATLHEIGNRATLLNPLLDRVDQYRFSGPATGFEADIKREVMERSTIDRADLRAFRNPGYG
jgi:hypothetical protein